MHIPDGFLDPKVSAGMMGAAAVVLSFCFAKLKAALTEAVPARAFAAAGNGLSGISEKTKRVLSRYGERHIYKMGMVAALVFVAQMFDFPISGGTSGHLIGAVFAAVILGPFAGAIVISAVLLIQMLFFADGGLFALGANIVNMAVIGSIGCCYIYYYLKKIMPEWISVSIAAWLSVILASLSCSIQIAMSGAVDFKTVSITMLKVHIIIGIAEALLTLALIDLFRRLPLKEREL